MPSTFSSPVLMLPGYGGSGPTHWQTLWERENPGFTRVEEKDWDAPDLEAWVAALEAAVARSGPGTVLVAHSLACLQVAHWNARSASAGGRAPGFVRAALLVAPPDPAGPIFPEAARGFDPFPRAPLKFPALVVGSTNDPYALPEFTEACARDWGARFASAGAAGHINAGSGLGEWPQGRALLLSLLR